MEIFERYVFHKGLLYPGAIHPESEIVKHKKMLLHERDSFNMKRIKKMSTLHPNSIWDPENADYGALVDSVMLGFTYVTIDGWLETSRLKIAHALCKNAITKFKLNKSIELTLKRLDDLKNIIQRPILIIGFNPGDVEKFCTELNPSLAKMYNWYFAPSVSNEKVSNSNIKISGWCTSTNTMME